MSKNIIKKCCYGLCESTSVSPECKDVTFIRFPQPKYNLTKCRQWAQLCGRSDFSHKNVSTFTWICSKHFPKDVDLDFRKNKDLEPYLYPGQVSRSAPKPLKTYGRAQRKVVAVPVPVLAAQDVPTPPKIDFNGNKGDNFPKKYFNFIC